MEPSYYNIMWWNRIRCQLGISFIIGIKFIIVALNAYLLLLEGMCIFDSKQFSCFLMALLVWDKLRKLELLKVTFSSDCLHYLNKTLVTYPYLIWSIVKLFPLFGIFCVSYYLNNVYLVLIGWFWSDLGVTDCYLRKWKILYRSKAM